MGEGALVPNQFHLEVPALGLPSVARVVKLRSGPTGPFASGTAAVLLPKLGSQLLMLASQPELALIVVMV
jgi:hypothetical protein